MISDLLWGDPTRHQDLQGLHPNRTRGCSIYFGVMAIQARAWLHAWGVLAGHLSSCGLCCGLVTAPLPVLAASEHSRSS